MKAKKPAHHTKFLTLINRSISLNRWVTPRIACVARLTKSVNFTFLMTVGNLSSAKLKFWLVAKQNERNLKIVNCSFYIYVPNPFHWQKMREKLFLVPKSSGPLLERLPLTFLLSLFLYVLLILALGEFLLVFWHNRINRYLLISYRRFFAARCCF